MRTFSVRLSEVSVTTGDTVSAWTFTAGLNPHFYPLPRLSHGKASRKSTVDANTKASKLQSGYHAYSVDRLPNLKRTPQLICRAFDVDTKNAHYSGVGGPDCTQSLLPKNSAYRDARVTGIPNVGFVAADFLCNQEFANPTPAISHKRRSNLMHP